MLSSTFDPSIDFRSRSSSERAKCYAPEAWELSIGYLHDISKFVDKCAEAGSTDDPEKWSSCASRTSRVFLMVSAKGSGSVVCVMINIQAVSDMYLQRPCV